MYTSPLRKSPLSAATCAVMLAFSNNASGDTILDIAVLCPNRRESVRFRAGIVIAFDCGGYGLSRSHRGAARRLALRFFLVVCSHRCEILKILKKTQVAYKQHIRMKTRIEQHELLPIWQGSCFFSNAKAVKPHNE